VDVSTVMIGGIDLAHGGSALTRVTMVTMVTREFSDSVGWGVRGKATRFSSDVITPNPARLSGSTTHSRELVLVTKTLAIVSSDS